jgi:hypothetical protein
MLKSFEEWKLVFLASTTCRINAFDSSLCICKRETDNVLKTYARNENEPKLRFEPSVIAHVNSR